MKKIVLLFILITFQSCWVCPEKQSLEFTKSTKTIKILSEDYYIKSIRVTEYLPMEKYIELVDSNYVEFRQNGSRGTTEIVLENCGENYVRNGKSDLKSLLNTKYLEYVVILEKFKNKKDGNFDQETIRFVTEKVKTEKNIFESNQPCP